MSDIGLQVQFCRHRLLVHFTPRLHQQLTLPTVHDAVTTFLTVFRQVG